MLHVRKVYQKPPPCSRLSQRFLACREFRGTGHAWRVGFAEWVVSYAQLHLHNLRHPAR